MTSLNSVNGTIISGVGSGTNTYVMNSNYPQKRREIIEKFMNFSVHTLVEYKNFIKKDYIKKVEKTPFRSDNLNHTYYFKKLWVTGMVFDFKKKEQIIIEPFETLCRMDILKRTKAVIDFCKDVDDLFDRGEHFGFTFNSKNLKKCFSKDEADEQYIYMRDKYREKITKDVDKMNSFLNNIAKYTP